jgi:hypothetical protein
MYGPGHAACGVAMHERRRDTAMVILGQAEP